MFTITRRSRLIACLAVAGAVALVPAAASSAAEAPSLKSLNPAAIQKGASAGKHDASRKASAKQTRKATKKLNRIAKRAGLVPTGKPVGRGYFVNGGYGCFNAPAWNYTICFGYTGYGSGAYQVFEWGDSAGRSGYSYISTLEVFLYGIGG
jgi:hypothetical protein